jgi:hypothetical protein
MRKGGLRPRDLYALPFFMVEEKKGRRFMYVCQLIRLMFSPCEQPEDPDGVAYDGHSLATL